MIQMIRPFGEPVEAIKELLGSSYDREYLGLSNICGLIQENRPKKIVKVGAANSSGTAAVCGCIDMLRLACQLYIVDSLPENSWCMRPVFDLEKDMEQRITGSCRLFSGHTLASWLNEIGEGIDLLILEAADSMPGNLLDFITAFPYLTPNAIVVLCGTLSDGPAGNVLFQNVTADKASAHLTPDLNVRNCLKFMTVDTVSAFQVNSDTSGHILDLFASLSCQWRSIPRLECLLEYEMSIKAHYDSDCLKLYRQAVLNADPYKNTLAALGKSLLESFSQVLLYGKGKRGEYFLKLSKLLGIHVTGFVVSDGQNILGSCEGLPVYSFSRIPFSANEVFVFQTAASREIEERLRRSEFHWMSLPESFWADCDYV